MKTISLHLFRLFTGIIYILFSSNLSASAQLIISSSEMDLLTQAHASGGPTDTDDPSPASASGQQTWSGSTSSQGLNFGEAEAYGNYSTRVQSNLIRLAGDNTSRLTGVANDTGTSTASGVLTTIFTVAGNTFANITIQDATFTSDAGANTSAIVSFLLEEVDGAELVRYDLDTRMSVSDSVELVTGTTYRLTLSLSTSAVNTANASASASSPEISLRAVPEPTGTLLLGASLCMLLSRRRMRKTRGAASHTPFNYINNPAATPHRF